MTSIFRTFSLFFALFCFFPPSPSSWAGRSPNSQYQGKTFTFRIRGEPETLDWNRAHTPVEAALLLNLMEGLVSLDNQLKVVPALAESWQISSDGKIYTFKLRAGVKWSDGVELKAKDFVYSWRRLLSPLTAATYAYFLFDIEGARAFHEGKFQSFQQVGVKALDDRTLEVRLERPVAHWITIPAFWVTFPLREDVVSALGSAWATPGRMVNLGPYSLLAHDFGSRIVLKANPNYSGARGNLDLIIAQIINDDTAALSLFEAGKLDFLNDLSPSIVKKMKSRAEFKNFSHFKTNYLGFVLNQYPASNQKLRRAIAMALDRSQLMGANSPIPGSQVLASSFVPPGMLGYSSEVGIQFDPVAARRELQASGLGSPQSIKLDYLLPDWEKSLAIGKWVQSQLQKNLGITIELSPMENKVFRNQLALQGSPLFELSWTADYPDPDNFLSVFLSSSGNSHVQWKNAQFDSGVENARRETDPKKRDKMYTSLQKLLQEQDVVMIPLYYEPNLALISARAKNVQLNPLDFLYLRSVHVVPEK